MLLLLRDGRRVSEAQVPTNAPVRTTSEQQTQHVEGASAGAATLQRRCHAPPSLPLPAFPPWTPKSPPTSSRAAQSTRSSPTNPAQSSAASTCSPRSPLPATSRACFTQCQTTRRKAPLSATAGTKACSATMAAGCTSTRPSAAAWRHSTRRGRRATASPRPSF